MDQLIKLKNQVVDKLDPAGDWVALLPIRLLLAYEFGKAGLGKFNGNNWFAHIKDNFPFPFNHVPVELSWFISTWSELIGSLMLLVGLFTRFWSLTLIVLSIVAIAAVHWPESYGSIGELLKGYAITDKGYGNYKLPLLYIILFIPLLFNGAGKASVDHLLARYLRQR